MDLRAKATDVGALEPHPLLAQRPPGKLRLSDVRLAALNRQDLGPVQSKLESESALAAAEVQDPQLGQRRPGEVGNELDRSARLFLDVQNQLGDGEDTRSEADVVCRPRPVPLDDPPLLGLEVHRVYQRL